MSNDKRVRRMMTAAAKRARVARVMVTTMRAAGNKEGKGGTGNCISNEGWGAMNRAMAMVTRAMAMRMMGERQQQG
jgi:hypothetical protein